MYLGSKGFGWIDDEVPVGRFSLDSGSEMESSSSISSSRPADIDRGCLTAVGLPLGTAFSLPLPLTPPVLPRDDRGLRCNFLGRATTPPPVLAAVKGASGALLSKAAFVALLAGAEDDELPSLSRFRWGSDKTSS